MYYRNKTLTAKYRSWRKKAQSILPEIEIPEGPLELTVYAYFSNKARDLDNILKPLQDTLQERYGFNDNRIYSIRAVKMLCDKQLKEQSEGIYLKIKSYKGNLMQPTYVERKSTKAVLPVYTQTGDKDLSVWDVEMMDRRRGSLTHCSHYVITRDGSVNSGRTPDSCIGNECADFDKHTVWIKVVGNPEEITEAQEKALHSLTTHLEEKYGVN